MKRALKQVSALMDSPEDHIRKYIHHDESAISFYGHSIHKKEKAIIAMARDHKSRFILVISPSNSGNFAKFSGETVDGDSLVAKKCPLNEHNASVIREIFPWTAPTSLKNRRTTIGCGDRIGIATSGHIAAIREYQAFPVLLQHSIKQLKLTGRTYKEVMDETSFNVFQSGYKGGYGADGNQLKSISDINIALAAGIPMITLDLEEHLNPDAMCLPVSEMTSAFENLPEAFRERVRREYFDQTFHLRKGSLTLNAATAMRCAVMYGRAVNFVEKAWAHIGQQIKTDFDLEVSLFEKPWITLPEDHLFIVRELSSRGIRFSSFAPRFVGEFIRGSDYPGNTGEFARQFEIHCEIARTFGGYKISIHNGSDKYRIHPLIGRLSEQHFHLKTAGTSWLEGMALIAAKDPVLYRVIHRCVVDSLPQTVRHYAFDRDMGLLPDLDKTYDDDLLNMVQSNAVLRQLLHISYGPVLNNSAIRPLLASALHRYEEEYHEMIKKLFVRHLEALGIPGRQADLP